MHRAGGHTATRPSPRPPLELSGSALSLRISHRQTAVRVLVFASFRVPASWCFLRVSFVWCMLLFFFVV